MSPLALWPQRVRYAYDRLNPIYVNNDIDACEATLVPSLPVSPEGRERPEMGRLGQAVEGRREAWKLITISWIGKRIQSIS
jgi:hypothetical protein